MSKIYIVSGSTGEYSDRIEWLVAAYADERLAQKHVELAEARVRELKARDDWDDIRMEHYGESFGDVFGPLDPGFQFDYTGTRYSVQSVDLLDVVPTTEGPAQ